MMTKFSNLDDFFKFLDLKRAEISREFGVTEIGQVGEVSEISEMTIEEPTEADTIKEVKEKHATYIVESASITLESQTTTTTTTATDKTSFFSQESLIESELIQMAWSTSMETPQKATDTTMIMDNLNLNESDFDYDYEEEKEEDLFESDAVDPLGLDSLAFPMSQFLKTTEPEFQEEDEENEMILDEIISEFELDLETGKNQNLEDEFDFDITMSQIPSTQVAQKEFNVKEEEPVEESLVPVSVGFTTGSGKSLPPPSKEAMKRARSLVELDDLEEEEKREKENIAMPLSMFTTGRGKPMPPPSEEAMKRAKSLVDTDQQDSYITDTPAMSSGFSTGRGKALPPPSKEAMDRANKLINEEGTEPVSSVGFSTGRGRVLPPPSKEALDRANRLMNDSTEPVGFSTGRGKAVPPPSEEALARAKRLINAQEDKESCAPVVGFSTGKGKALPPPSKEALKKAASLIGDQTGFPVYTTADSVAKTVNKKQAAFRPSVPGNTAFKPPSLIKTAAAPPPKPFSLSTAWKTPRNRQPVKQVVKVEPVKLFDLSTEGMERFKFKDFFNSSPNLAISNYTPYRIPMDILRIESRSAGEFKFPDGWGVKEAHAALSANGAQSVSISLDWTRNHFRWIIWKFASILRCFPEKYSVQNLSPGWVLQQLLYRYEREIHQCHRSALKKIIERDDAAGKYLCLMVATVDKEGRCLELSDGWYSIWTGKLDDSFWDLVEGKKRIFEGMKIEISGASLTGGQDGIPALEAASKDSQCRLTITRNSCRPARWDTKLGFVCTPNRAVAFLKHLHQVHPQGGPIPALSLIIDRVYPLLFREETTGDKASKVVRNERDHYLYLECNPEQAANSKFTPIQRIKVVGNCAGRDSAAVVSFWNPMGEDQRALLQEGTAVIITNLRANTARMQLSLVSAKSTRIFKDTVKKSDYCTSVIKIELANYEMLVNLKLNESYDVQGIVLGRVGTFFWLGGLTPADSPTFLICLKNFNTAINNRGDVINFRDLAFNYFDGREGVAHFTFTEYSDHKKETVLKPECFDVSMRRFQHLTNVII